MDCFLTTTGFIAQVTAIIDRWSGWTFEYEDDFEEECEQLGRENGWDAEVVAGILQ